ncbi:unnamed protein product [Rhizophagus irregularis]|nr:unnamed protein product [Rhizophagus irregularis]
MHVPKLSFERSLVIPNYYLHDRAALGQGFPPNINYYFDIEEEPAKLQRLEKETNTKEQEKENSNVENESHDISKKKFATKRKATDDAEIWQNHEIDLLLQYIEDNFDEYRKGNKSKLFNAISANVLKNKKSNGIKSKLSRMIKMYSEVKKHNEKSGEARKDWV